MVERNAKVGILCGRPESDYEFFAPHRNVIERTVVRDNGAEETHTGLQILHSTHDVVVRDCVFDRNYRQGFSLISVINLLVERCTFSNTNGTDPQAGVDLEPDFPSHQLTNVTFRDCSYTGNAGSGFRSCLNALNASTHPVSILFSGGLVRNNTVMANRVGSRGHSVGASYFRPGLHGDVTYENIDIRDCAAAGIKVSYKAVNSPQLTLRNISVANVAWADRVVPDPMPGPDIYHVGPVMFVGDCCITQS